MEERAHQTISTVGVRVLPLSHLERDVGTAPSTEPGVGNEVVRQHVHHIGFHLHLTPVAWVSPSRPEIAYTIPFSLAKRFRFSHLGYVHLVVTLESFGDQFMCDNQSTNQNRRPKSDMCFVGFPAVRNPLPKFYCLQCWTCKSISTRG